MVPTTYLPFHPPFHLTIRNTVTTETHSAGIHVELHDEAGYTLEVTICMLDVMRYAA